VILEIERRKGDSINMRFTVLASGSGGNASLVEAGGFGVLLDAGIGPRTLTKRLDAVGASWNHVHAMVLTHTHTDHWQEATFRHLLRREIPVYCHKEHHQELLGSCEVFADLFDARLVHFFDGGQELHFSVGLRCRPVRVRHDSGATFGFRFEGAADLYGRSPALAYLADLGCWDDALVQAVLNVDLLALEFNHDVEMERTSGRSPFLIARVLGDEGHLSNAQAAEFVREVLRQSTPERLRHLVQLHLSRECNRPTLAAAVGKAALGASGCDGKVVTARQDRASGMIDLCVAGTRRRACATRQSGRAGAGAQALLPGLETA
jgi:phosphoribosyl 1,2-cyclic phosphodiesterase